MDTITAASQESSQIVSESSTHIQDVFASVQEVIDFLEALFSAFAPVKATPCG